jgi:hypothetical protein
MCWAILELELGLELHTSLFCSALVFSSGVQPGFLWGLGKLPDIVQLGFPLPSPSLGCTLLKGKSLKKLFF